ncbi:MAG: MMPL family transporter [Pseudomonadota bacterium]
MSSFLENIFCRYLGFANKHRLACAIVIAVLFVVSLYLASGLKLRSSLKELLPENSPSVVYLDRMLDRVGGISVLTVAVESSDVAANMKFIDDLNEKLAELPTDDVRYVIAKVAEIKKFYEDNMLHYVNYDDLKTLYSRIKKLVDYEKFKRTPFFLDLEMEEPPLSLRYQDIEERNRKNVKMPLAVYEDYYGGEDGHFLMLMVRPHGTSIAVDKARALIKKVKGIVARLNPTSYSPDMKVGYCGNLVSTVEEYDTLKKDMFSTAGLCIFLVCGAIALYFLRLRIVAFLGATLLIGITFTFAVTRITIGYLNAQTAFLASIIIGTGINYGIILMGRYLEERKSGTGPRPAMEHALAATAVPTFLAAATTAVSFSILMIAQVRGLSQFGFIGSVGVMLCWLSTMLFLPLMVVISERVVGLFRKLSPPKRKSALFPEVDRILSHSPVVIVAFFTIVAIGAIIIVHRYIPNSIEYDFSKLRNSTSAISGTEALERRVSKLWVGSMTPAVVLLDKPEDGPVVCNAVMRQNAMRPPAERMVDNCVNVYDLLPKDQDEKAVVLKQYDKLLSEQWIGQVGGQLGRQLQAMKKSLKKTFLGIDDLPKDLVRNFEDLHGNIGTFAFINPRSGMPLSDGRNLIRFADTIRDIDLPDGRVVHATGESLIFSDLVKIVKKEAPILMLASFFAVSIFVLFIARKMSQGYVIIASLIWVVFVMVAAMSLFGIRINFFNFIALPLTFGVGVDYAINIAARFHEKKRSRTYDIIRHTGGAVALCASTTIIGYSVLTKSTNQAVAQFGFMAVIGEFACIFSAMLLVPAVIILAMRIKEQRAGRRKRDANELCEES